MRKKVISESAFNIPGAAHKQVTPAISQYGHANAQKNYIEALADQLAALKVAIAQCVNGSFDDLGNYKLGAIHYDHKKNAQTDFEGVLFKIWID